MKKIKKLELETFANKLNNAIRFSYDVPKKIKTKFGLTYLGSGISRGVYKTKKFPGVVFKIEFSRDNTSRTSPNNSEFSFFKRATKAQKKYIAATIYITKNYRVLVQEETPQRSAKRKDILKFLRKMTKVIPYQHRWDTEEIQGLRSDNSWGCTARPTLTPHNIGTVSPGVFKLFDYATQATTC